MNAITLQEALGALKAGDTVRAARLCADILRDNPQHFDALFLLGSLHLQEGRAREAEPLLVRAAARNPNSAETFFACGRALMHLSRFEEARDSFQRVVQLDPKVVGAWGGLGKAHFALGHFRDAAAAAERALSMNANIAAAWNDRGMALMELTEHAEALTSFEKALALNEATPQFWNNRANALMALGRRDEALGCFDQALSFPNAPATMRNNRAKVLLELGRNEEAARDYTALLAAVPDFPYALGNLVFAKLNVSDWSDLGVLLPRVSEGVRAAKPVIAPAAFATICHSPEEQWQCAETATKERYPPSVHPLWRGERYSHDKIRLAYLSAEFGIHAVSSLAAGVYEGHDRARFETYALSCAPGDGSPMRARLEKAFTHFVDLSGKGEREIAAWIRENEIDIAVDLMGLTRNSRSGVFAQRAAPVQVNFLAFPGTVGASYMDYIIADPVVAPDGHRRFFSEQLVHMPDSYMPTDAARRMGAVPGRREAGLPDEGFVFCSFNNNAKLLPDIFAVWMRLLQARERSVLWLPAPNAPAIANLRKQAQQHGVAPERLVFAPYAPNDETHLARLSLADLFLDSLPYNAHATAADALQAGVPLLTCLGPTFAGRVAASLLHAAGLPELVTSSLEDYEAMALRLSEDAAALGRLKARLHDGRATAPLFDTVRYTRHLEAAYTRMWQRAAEGLPPSGFAVE